MELGPEGPLPSFTETQLDEHIVWVVLSHQHSIRKGRGLFGKKADTAITKELQQIHELETYDPVYKSDLSQKERKDALESLMFITEKTNGTVKARKIADGSKQHTYDGYEKSDGSSPTVITERIFLIGVVDARERQAQAVLDIANAFLHADNDERISCYYAGGSPK